jgi:hypothetical protein
MPSVGTANFLTGSENIYGLIDLHGRGIGLFSPGGHPDFARLRVSIDHFFEIF